MGSYLLRWCGGRDSNPRRPTPRDPQSSISSKPDFIYSLREIQRLDGLESNFRVKNLEIRYSEIREEFKEWLSRYSEEYSKEILRYLDRYLGDFPLKSAKDLLKLVNSVKSGRRHLCYSIRVLVNFLEEFGLIGKSDANLIRSLVKIPKSGVDNYVPRNEEVLEAYSKIEKEETRLVFELLMFSGMRIVEASELLSKFEKSKLIALEEIGISRYPISLLRGTKRIYYAYMPFEFSLKLRRIRMSPKAITKRLIRVGLAGKYLRKWNYNFLIERGVPESVADFIQGRAPVSVGSMHYLAKVRQADIWYSKVSGEMVSLINRKRDGSNNGMGDTQ